MPATGDHTYPIAIDGSQKLAGDTLWAEELLQRSVGKGETRHLQYFVYVLEASLVFHNGLVVPLLSEFLERALLWAMPKRKTRIANCAALCA